MTHRFSIPLGLILVTSLALSCGDDDDASPGGSADAGEAGIGAGGAQGGAAGNAGAGARGGNGGNGAVGATGGDAGAGAGAAGAPEGGASGGGAGGTPDAGAAGDAAGMGGASGGGSVSCPDVFGTYEIASVVGSCGNLDTDAAQTIEGTTEACFAHFVSIGGINGGANLDQGGDFMGATLILGSTMRTPCSGDWDGERLIAIACGGTSGLCSILLNRQ